eukprot:Pompholyxophrys_sp_v1_NODE_3_length_18401_cov_4.332280.p9 type:complete len:177 gc:universal NODE_3_length_18401_cov_4.332280:12382-12912(+)
MKYTIGKCTLGNVLVAVTYNMNTKTESICALFLGDDPKYLVDEMHKAFMTMKKYCEPNETLTAESELNIMKEVISYIENLKQDMKFKLDIKGTEFQKKVWTALLTLNDSHKSKTITYGEIAEMIGSPKAIRAVAGACANNQIAVLIPCHKVIRKDGKPSGYRWGLDLKNQLNVATF